MALSINTDLPKFDVPTSNTGGCPAKEFESYCLLAGLKDNFRNEKIQTSSGRFRQEKPMLTDTEIRILCISTLGFLD